MLNRIVFILAAGVLAPLGASSSAGAGGFGCGGCAPPVYYAPPHNCCHQQPVYVPVPISYCCQMAQPTPVYVVNQGPVYSGPNIAVMPAPYVGYGPPPPYPYVGAGYYGAGYYTGGPYADPYRHRVRPRYSMRVRHYHRQRYEYRRPPRARVVPIQPRPPVRPMER